MELTQGGVPAVSRGRSRAPLAVLLAAAVIVGAAWALGQPWPGSARSGSAPFACVDVTAEVGLAFQGLYGTTVAPDEGGTIMQRNMGNGAAVGDYNDDGYLDVYLLGQAGERNVLYRNETGSGGSRKFTDVTAIAGVEDLGLGRIAHFADLDGDGRLDLLLVNDADPEGRLPASRIFQNLGDGTFRDVTQGSGFSPVGYLVGGATLADVDLDGDLDVFLTYWTMELGGTPSGRPPMGALPGANRLYRNDGGFRFTDVTDAMGLGGISRDSFTPIFHDFDGDGDLDLYIAVDHREDLYYEQRDGRFVDRSVAANVNHVGNDMGVALTDVDGDGVLDMFVTNIYDPEENFGKKPRGNTLLVTDRTAAGVRFEDLAFDFGVRETAWGWGTAFVDMDLDGDLELVIAQGFDEFVSIYSKSLYDASSYLFTRDGTGRFEPVHDSGCDVPGDQRALIPFDFDRDGDSDLLITQVGLPAILLENRTSGQHSLTVRLDGPAGRGSGARVDVTVGGHTSTQLVMHGASYLSGPPLEALFGLGDAAVADEVRVTDVRGATVVLRDVPANQILRVDLP